MTQPPLPATALVPRSDAPQAELRVFAQSYDGYLRLAAGPVLEQVVAPVEAWLTSHRQVPDWAGVDLLRGYLFALLQREAPPVGPDLDDPYFAELNWRWRTVVWRIGLLSGGVVPVYA